MQAVEQRLRANDSVVSAEIDGESVLLNVETGIYFGLDAIGTLIWELLEQKDGVTEDEICGRLLEEYEVAPGEVRCDVGNFVAQLAAKGLVQAV